MKSIIFLILIFCSKEVYANISNAFFQDTDKSLLVFFDSDNESYLYKTSLRECRNIDKYNLGNVNIAILSKYIPSYIIMAGSGELKLYNMVTRKTMWIAPEVFKPIKTILQDSTGEYISISDGFSVSLYRFKKDSLELIFTKEFQGGVVSAIPDSENSLLYIAERNGNITIWSFLGNLNKSVNISIPISKMFIDNRFNRIVTINNSGLFAINKDNLAVSQLIKGWIKDIIIDERYNRLIVQDGKGIALYDYNKLSPFFNRIVRSNKIANTTNANFLATIFNNELSLFDIKKGLNIAVITYSKKGVLFSGGMNELTYNPINTILNNKPAEDLRTTCALLASLVTGVYSPNEFNLAKINAPKTRGIENNTNVNNIDDLGDITIDSVANINAPKVNNIRFKSNINPISEVKSSSNIKSPNNVKQPTINDVKLPQTITSTSVPAWFANRKSLPAYTSVRSGGSDYSAGVKAAKKQIKDEVVRAVLRDIINNGLTKSITNEQLKKRFLWQVASNVAISLDKNITIVDSFISPAKQTYVYAKLDPNLIKKEIQNNLNIEEKLLTELTEKEYMDKKINAIE